MPQHTSASAPFRVLSNPGSWRDGDNPFLKMLFDSYGDSVEIIPFTWRRAFGRGYEVIHIHWLEYLVRSERGAAQVVKRILFAGLLVRLRLIGTPSVWTVHNDQPHDRSGSVVERILLNAWARLVSHRVFLTAAARLAAGSPENSSVIPHGHYRPVLTHDSPAPPDPRCDRMIHFGHLRPYKGIEDLLSAFDGAWPTARGRPSLTIVGRPKDPGYGAVLGALVEPGGGVDLRQEFLSDERLEAEIAQAGLVVLPYRKMYNSGAVLLALSIGRPVLVPDSATMRELADEVGSEWVRRFVAPLGSADLRAAMAAAPPSGRPDLSLREWAPIGRDYARLFRDLAAPRRTGSAR